MTETKPKCPICREAVELRTDGNETFPFCGDHCQMHDLGNWLNEIYTMPIGADGTERALPPEELN